MKKIIVLFFAISFLTDCRKTPDFDELSSQFIVSTNLDKDADFGTYSSFYIADTIVNIGGIGSDSIIVGADAQQLVQTVKDNLTSRGYIFKNRDNNPDLGLTLTAIKDVNVIVNYYPGWWDGYWPGCYWYYWCYPYYYPWTTVYSYSTGTIILNMYDLKNADQKSQLTGIWNLTALGAIGTSISTNLQLGIDAINQGFEQSPYVSAN